MIDSNSVMDSPLGLAQQSGSHRSHGSRPFGRWPQGVVVMLALVGACSRSESPQRGSNSTTPRAGTIAPASSSPDSDARRVVSIGQGAAGKGYSITAVRVLECRGREGWRPKPGHVFLGIELQAKETSGESIALGHSHARLLDRHGRALAAEPYVKTENCEPLLKYTRLSARGSLVGWVVFSVPLHEHSLKLSVAPRDFMHEPPLIFDLGR